MSYKTSPQRTGLARMPQILSLSGLRATLHAQARWTDRHPDLVQPWLPIEQDILSYIERNCRQVPAPLAIRVLEMEDAGVVRSFALQQVHAWDGDEFLACIELAGSGKERRDAPWVRTIVALTKEQVGMLRGLMQEVEGGGLE